MTTGPDSRNSVPQNHAALRPRDDREALSALFDGELAPDAVRFALRRMEHDTGWREACGRWQLIGDVLRGGETAAAAPAGFADGVRHAIAVQARADRAVGSASPMFLSDGLPGTAARRRTWMGGAAVAASVALAALFVMRPGSQMSQSPGEPRLAAEPARATVPATGPAGASRSQPARSLPTDRAIEAPGLRVASATREPPGSTRRPSRAAPTPTSEPASAGRSFTALTAGEPAAAAIASAPVMPVEPETLFAPTGDVVARPWPRAVLPGSASQSLTVGFGDPAAPSPSFYPFEPRLPAEQGSPVAEPQR